MKIRYTFKFRDQLAATSKAVQNSFYKQVRWLAKNIRHPSLRAKKYDETQDLWQARVNKDWRFFFTIRDNTYTMITIVHHPK